MLPIILASTSPYRAAILRKLGIDFRAAAPRIDESGYPDESAAALAARLSQQKALAVAARYPTHYIIGSDQTVAFEGDILGKPLTHDHATEQLRRFSGRSVRFFTGLTLINSASGTQQTVVDDFSVHFRVLTEDTIERYLQHEQPYDCAGSFKSEGLGITLFERLEGKDPNTLIGLPLIELTTLFANDGVVLPL